MSQPKIVISLGICNDLNLISMWKKLVAKSQSDDKPLKGLVLFVPLEPWGNTIAQKNYESAGIEDKISS